MADVVDDGEDSGVGMTSPFDWMEETLTRDESSSNLGGGDCIAIDVPGGGIAEECGAVAEEVAVAGEDGLVEIGPDGIPAPGQADRDRGPDEEDPFWWQSLLLLGVIGALAVAAASRRLRTPANKER